MKALIHRTLFFNQAGTKALWILALTASFCFFEMASASSPSTFTYQGRLTDSSGTAIVESSVVLKFRILNTAGDCIIYSETQTISTASTAGTFSVELGSAPASGKRNSEDRGNTMDAVFSNNGTPIPGKDLASPTSNCASDYTPTSTDDRKLQILVLSTASQPTLNLTLSPLQRITSVPYATVAQTLNGYSSSQFLRLTGAAVAPTARVTAGNVNTVMDRLFTTQSTGYDRLDDILTNWGSNISISSNNLNVNSNKITNLATPTAGGDAVNKTYSDGYVGGQASSGLGALAGGDSGKSLVWNGTNWVAQTLNSLPTQTGNSGKFLTTDGTSASWASTGTVTSATATAPLEVSGTATTAPNVRFVAGTAINDNFVLTITNGNQPAFVNSSGLYVLKGGQAGALSLGTSDATDLTFLTTNAARVTVKSGGNVGIGTTTPLDLLSLGSVTASSTNAALNLSNTALSGASASGTYLGANPASAGADFINYQVNGTTKFSVDKNGIVNANQAYVTLTDGATVTWTLAGLNNNASVTLGGNRSLLFSGLSSGMTGTLIVKQDATGGRTLTLTGNGCTNKVIGGGAGAVTLTATADAIDIITFTYDGTNCYWTYGANYN